MLQRRVHRCEVLQHDGLTALTVGLTNRLFDPRYGLVARQHAADGEEARLHDGVDAIAHPRFFGDRICIDREDLDVLVNDRLLNSSRQMFPNVRSLVRTVQEQSRAVYGRAEHRITFYEVELMNGDEVCALNQVGALDWLRSKAQVRYSHRAGFL